MSIFSKVAMKSPQRSTFNLSHERKFSMAMGQLIPILCVDTLPGDTFKLTTSQMMRFAPMVTPPMHQITVYTHYFFVPNRLLWENWEDFITGGEDGENASVFPKINWGSGNDTSLLASVGDYLGLPINTGGTIQVSALQFAAYYFIYNEYYRDQNLITEIPYVLDDGLNDPVPWVGEVAPLRRAWQHDYFTSALPWTQKGPEATIPLGTSADIDVTGGGLLNDRTTQSVIGRVDSTAFGADDITFNASSGASERAGIQVTGTLANLDVTGHTSIDSSALSVDLSTATAATINDLRQAFRLQEWLEKNARGGSRYTESILVHFKVKSPDGRLQRPEFLGGGSSPVVISEVLQTSGTDSEPTPQGNMAGHGISVGSNNGFKYRCTEHGFIMGIMSVMPKTGYMQGIPKQFAKFDKFDYAWPEFAHLGEQPIYNYEVYAQTGDGLNDDVFGYIPRYAEYKYHNSSVHGAFRTTLDNWHMDRKFSSRPNLNEDFINCDPTTRIFAVTDDEQLYCHVHHRMTANRALPYFGIPTI